MKKVLLLVLLISCIIACNRPLEKPPVYVTFTQGTIVDTVYCDRVNLSAMFFSEQVLYQVYLEKELVAEYVGSDIHFRRLGTVY